MILSVYKRYKAGDLKVVANVTLHPAKIEVHGTDAMAMQIIRVSLDFPTKKKIVVGKKVVKKEPETLEENLLLTLKQNVTNPYMVSEKFMKVENPKYKAIYDADVLNGGNVERRVDTAGIGARVI